MKLTATLIVVALAAFAVALPAPRLAVRSSQEVGKTGSTKKVKAKCWSGCGDASSVITPDSHWGTGFITGSQQVTTFPQLQQSFQNFASISGNTANFWQSQSQSFGVQQCADQFHQMVANLYQLVHPFSAGCNSVCGGGDSYGFQTTLSNFFNNIQAILVVIQNRYYNSIDIFQNDFSTLAACIQVVVAMAMNSNVNIDNIFGNLNVNLFAQFGMQITQYPTQPIPTLYDSVNSVPYYPAPSDTNDGLSAFRQ